MTTYTLFGQSGGGGLVADNASYTMGVQFTVSQSATLTGIWWYSAASAIARPETIALYLVSGTSLVHSEGTGVSPISWSGAAGSGWIRAAFATPPALTASTSYKACVFHATTAVNWYSSTAHYWDSGSGSGGITNGPLSAPNNAGASPGQGSFNAASPIAYPGTTFNATNYWMDPEITATVAAAPQAAFMSTM